MRCSACAARAGDSAGLVLTACQDAAARGGAPMCLVKVEGQ